MCMHVRSRKRRFLAPSCNRREVNVRGARSCCAAAINPTRLCVCTENPYVNACIGKKICVNEWSVEGEGLCLCALGGSIERAVCIRYLGAKRCVVYVFWIVFTRARCRKCCFDW